MSWKTARRNRRQRADPPLDRSADRLARLPLRWAARGLVRPALMLRLLSNWPTTSPRSAAHFSARSRGLDPNSSSMHFISPATGPKDELPPFTRTMQSGQGTVGPNSEQPIRYVTSRYQHRSAARWATGDHLPPILARGSLRRQRRRRMSPAGYPACCWIICATIKSLIGCSPPARGAVCAEQAASPGTINYVLIDTHLSRRSSAQQRRASSR
jgi:hypothetical protein